MNIPEYTFLNVYLKFSGEEGKKTGRMEERERQPTIFQDVTLSTSFFLPRKP